MLYLQLDYVEKHFFIIMGVFDYIKKIVGKKDRLIHELKSNAERFVAMYREERDGFDDLIEMAKGISDAPEVLSAEDFMKFLDGIVKLVRKEETADSVAASLGMTNEELEKRACLLVITNFYAVYLFDVLGHFSKKQTNKIIKILAQTEEPWYKLLFMTIKPADDRSPISLEEFFSKIVRIKNTVKIALSTLKVGPKKKNKEFDIDLNTFNSLNEAIQNNDFEQFKKIASECDERLLIAISRVINNYYNLYVVIEAIVTEDMDSLDIQVIKKFLSNIATFSDDSGPETICRFLGTVYFYEYYYVDKLDSDLSDAIDSIWEIVGLKDFINPYSKWCIEQAQELLDHLEEQPNPFIDLLKDLKESKGNEDETNSENCDEKNDKTPTKSHISVKHDIRIIEKLADYLVNGYDGASGHLINLVSSGDGNEKTKLVYLLTGNSKYYFDGPYKLEWNGDGTYLKLLIQLLYNTNKLETPEQAIDSNETDYISRTNIKTSFKGVWDKVGEAFERSGDSLKGAVFTDEKNKKKKKQDETKTPEEIELEKRLKEQRINEMTLIAEMWLKCLNGIDFND